MKCRTVQKVTACCVAVLLLVSSAMSAFAAEMTWSYDAESKTVSVKGYGMINDATALTGYLKDAKKIEVLKGVTKTDKNVFANLGGVEEVVLPDGFLAIGDNSFHLSRNLKKITLPDTLESIGKEAFMGCVALENVVIPKNVSTIGVNAFANCTGLTAFSVSEENQNFIAVDGVIFTGDKKELVMYPSGKEDETYQIPAGTTSVRERAFAYNAHLQKVTVPDSVREIGDYAFYFCERLNTVAFSEEPSGSALQSIGSYAFYGYKLRKLSLPYGVERIGSDAFKNCDTLSYLELPGTVQSIGENALYGTGASLKIGGYGDAVTAFANRTGISFSETVRVKINGREIFFDCPAVVRDGCTMVPMRRIFEELGAAVTWDDETQTARGEKDGTVCSFTIGDETLYKNGEAVRLLAPATLENDRTLVHVRAIAEAFGAAVDWDGASGLVSITN